MGLSDHFHCKLSGYRILQGLQKLRYGPLRSPTIPFFFKVLGTVHHYHHFHLPGMIISIINLYMYTSCFLVFYGNYYLRRWIYAQDFTNCRIQFQSDQYSYMTQSYTVPFQGFFRRSLSRKDQYKCSGTNDCEILPGKRTSCPYCRFQKCISVGMSKTGEYQYMCLTFIKNLNILGHNVCKLIEFIFLYV